MERRGCPAEGETLSNSYEGQIYQWPWPFIWKTFQGLEKKLRTVPPELRLAVLDWWTGQLFLLRAEVEAGKFRAKGRARKR